MRNLLFISLFCLIPMVKGDEIQSLKMIKKIAIIGGGMAGSSSLLFLSNSNKEVHLFEASSKYGGNARTHIVKGEDTVSVDMGPLVYATGSWDLFLQMQKYFNIKRTEFYKFHPSISVWNQGQENSASFITPKFKFSYLNWLTAKKGPIRDTFKFLALMQKSYKDFKKGKIPSNTSIKDWFEKEKADSKIISEILFPVFTSFHTVPFNELDKYAILPIMETTTFRSPLTVKKLYVSKNGIGTFIDNMVNELLVKNSNLVGHLNSKVTHLSKMKTGEWKVIINDDEENPMFFDSVIVATHPHQAKEFIKENEFGTIYNLLDKLKYHKQKVVLHSDEKYFLKESPRFLNIQKRSDQTLITTMKLSQIDKKFGKLLLTSGLTDNEYTDLKLTNKIIAEEIFYHPKYVTTFFETVSELKKESLLQDGPYFAGGWTHVGDETQETAAMSGYQAVLDLLKNDDSLKIWKKHFKKLREYFP